ncbi:Uncharacterized protein ALO55_05599 [Pseudomonas savastanoi pv. phaseolicola]|uniref:Uncharacterized protein n=1 Tax=Pseudomonas savastanoi pv. phaseolicola TaxID=319 RepID=A0ABD4BC18_PSESH|nr:Uncharacterized protein ALO55_05599 [Pseudomonas savastanoi pv. phaseolicola]
MHGPVRLAWRPARLPPDQRQGSAVTKVALCVVSAIAIKKRFVTAADGKSCSFAASETNCTLRIGR